MPQRHEIPIAGTGYTLSKLIMKGAVPVGKPLFASEITIRFRALRGGFSRGFTCCEVVFSALGEQNRIFDFRVISPNS